MPEKSLNPNELIKALTSRVPAILGSISAVALGAGLMLDDYKDIGKLGDERTPPRPHHWIWGVISLIAGVAGAGLTALDILHELGFKPPLESVEELKEPKSLLEGAPKQLLETLK